MFGRETILNKIPAGGGCTDIVDNYDPFDGNGVALYQLNGDATDVSGNYNAIDVRGLSYVDGVFGQAASFASNGNFNTGYSLSGSYTISLWCKNTATGYNVFSTVNSQNDVGIIFRGLRSGAVTFIDGWGGLGIGQYVVHSYTYPQDTNWHHFALSFTNNNNCKIYFDGALILDFNSAQATFSQSSPLTFGESLYASNDPTGINLDQVRIFNTALDPLEVEALYTEELCICDGTVDTLDILGDGSCIATYQLDGNANDLSGNYSGTPTNVSYGVGEFDLAGVFNGSTSRILNTVTATTITSFSMWVKINDTSTAQIIQTFGNNEYLISVYLGKLNVQYAATSTSGIGWNIANQSNWHHIAGTITSSSATLYVDGQQKTDTFADYFNGQSVGCIGDRSSGDAKFNGSIDQVRVFNKALSAGEVTTLYNETACTKEETDKIDISTATLVNTNTFTIGSNGNPRGFFVSFDGTRVFTTTFDTSGNDWIEQYNLSTPFDVTTMGGVAGSKQLSASISNYLSGVGSNLDNTWITYDPYSNNEYYSQPFGTAGDITTLGTLYTDSCTRTGGDPVATCNMISKDGNYAFRLTSARNMYTNTLSINNDLSSGSGCGSVSSLSDIETTLGAIPNGFNFNEDGTQFFVFARNGKVAAYRLAVSWDVSSRVNEIVYDFSDALESPNNVYALQFNSDYSKMIVCAANSSYTSYEIYEFDI